MEKRVKEKISDLEAALKKSGLGHADTQWCQSDLKTALHFSDFIASAVIRHPDILIDLLFSGDLEQKYAHGDLPYDRLTEPHAWACDYTVRLSAHMEASAIENVEDLKSVLTKIRMREMVRIAWRDLTGKADLEETLTDLSLLAQACVECAVSYLYDTLCEKCGTPLDRQGNPQGLVVLGMGKLGAHELNFSSDIDLIFAYAEDGPFNGGCRFHTVTEFFNRLCRNLVKLFDASGGGDPLFRMDTRLRPFGANGPIAMSFDAMEEYYQTQGREWERYALIKARPIAGDIAAGYRLLKLLNPFVYRRYFDYGSFDSLRDMKQRIAMQVKDKRYKNNIKLGAGGIREIEFFGQMFQLIRGGVEPEFQERKILKVLALLVDRDCIDAGVASELTSAYHFLRHTEHRLQEWQDQQTHDLPEHGDDKLRLAWAMGFDTWDAFNDVLLGHMHIVHGHFCHLFTSEDEDGVADEKERGGSSGASTVGDGGSPVQDRGTPVENDKMRVTPITHEALYYLWQHINDPQSGDASVGIEGVEEASTLITLLKTLSAHPNTQKLTRNGRKRLDRLVPVLVRKVIKQKNPEVILQRLVDLIITIERRTCYLSLLVERRDALETLVILASKSPWIITFLSQHPALLDELMDPATLYTPPDRAQMEASLARRMAHIQEDDFEFQLEELCIFKQVMMLRVAAADISGNYRLMKVSDRLTDIAEVVMAKVMEVAWHHTVDKYGTPDLSLEESNLNSHGVDPLDGALPHGAHSGEPIGEAQHICMAPQMVNGVTLSERGPDGEYHHGAYNDPRLEGTGCNTPGFAAIAYGKLGGLELGYKSDLDMVFLHSGFHGYTQGGRRSIENVRFYTFLGQRIINALTLHTQAGTLYETDMRLRPSGQSGMIVSHIDAFSEYVHHEAWTWEHQAIIRARPVVGDPFLMGRFNEIRDGILQLERAPKALKDEVRTMRDRLRQEHLKPMPGCFDLKQGRGGIVDIEFLVQYLVLQHAATHPGLTRWTDNVRLIEALMAEDILTEDEAMLLKEGYLMLRQQVHHLNLQEKEKQIPLEEFEKKGEKIYALFDRCVSEV